MIVCVCKAMSVRAVRERIAAGARSLDELAATTGVTTDCGTCREAILELIEESTGAGNGSERGGNA